MNDTDLFLARLRDACPTAAFALSPGGNRLAYWSRWRERWAICCYRGVRGWQVLPWDAIMADDAPGPEAEWPNRLFGIRCWAATSDNLPQNRISVLTRPCLGRTISTVESEVWSV